MKKIPIKTLGCKVNQYDAEAMAQNFARFEELNPNDDISNQVEIVFTCGVTQEAQRKSMQAVRRATREGKKVVVAGCGAQLWPQKYMEIPGVILTVGSQNRSNAPLLTSQALFGMPISAVHTLTNEYEETPVTRSRDRTRAQIKIQEGCSRNCAYCIIPQARGPERSRSLEMIRQEALRLSQQDCKEVVLTGINLATFGQEWGKTLADAVRVVADCGIGRIRIGSIEPDLVTPQLVEALQKVPELCTQFHIPIQSGCQSVLQRMGRRCTIDHIRSAAFLLRQAFDGCALGTDVMVGFPGETQDEFQETLAFCKDISFANMHVFGFSPRPNTPAESMPDPVSPTVQKQRLNALLHIAEEMQTNYERSLVGQQVEVLWEKVLPDGICGQCRQGVVIKSQQGETGQVNAVLVVEHTPQGLTGITIN